MFRCLVRFSVLPPCSPDCSLSPLLLSRKKAGFRRHIADAYGLASWPKSNSIRYTFNVDADEKTCAQLDLDVKTTRYLMKAQTVPASQRRFSYHVAPTCRPT